MAEARVTWHRDFQFIGTDSTNHSVVLSKPGEDSIGMKPSELLLVALAGCTGFDVVNILRKKRLSLRDFESRSKVSRHRLRPGHSKRSTFISRLSDPTSRKETWSAPLPFPRRSTVRSPRPSSRR